MRAQQLTIGFPDWSKRENSKVSSDSLEYVEHDFYTRHKARQNYVNSFT